MFHSIFLSGEGKHIPFCVKTAVFSIITGMGEDCKAFFVQKGKGQALQLGYTRSNGLCSLIFLQRNRRTTEPGVRNIAEIQIFDIRRPKADFRVVSVKRPGGGHSRTAGNERENDLP